MIDIAKYIVTGVIIASLFKDVENEIFVYGIVFVLAASSLVVGLVLCAIGVHVIHKNENSYAKVI